jgi:hypothetical protein
LFAAALACGAAIGGTTAAGVRCTIRGTAGPDRLVGTGRNDVICAGAGADEIFARGGRDVVLAGSGNDVIYPGKGRDRVIAGDGADTIFAADGVRDVIDGGKGRDRVLRDRTDRLRSVEERFSAGRGRDPILLAAGDIAACDVHGDETTAALLDLFPTAAVGALGDNAYEAGTDAEFANCYGPSWGRAKRRTHPTPGDHDYGTPGAAGYFRYFGGAAGEAGKGYYSYDLGSWHVAVLNSTCVDVPGGCGAASPEAQWLRADLAAHRTSCTLAYWHRPRFSSSSKASPFVQPFWQILAAAGAELVLSGDNHVYERFQPLDAAGNLDAARGMRQFVIGTGGRSHGSFGAIDPRSEVRNRDTFGVLKLTLRPGAYSWRFVPEAGKRFADAGSAPCR